MMGKGNSKGSTVRKGWKSAEEMMRMEVTDK